MKIVDIEVSLHHLQLVKPYKIANKTIDTVANCLVAIKLANGITGFGTGAPIDFVTGETLEVSFKALQKFAQSFPAEQSIHAWPAQAKTIQAELKNTPAAAAALDMAMYDAYGKQVSLPVVDILGRAHKTLPTSITVGIKAIDAAIDEALEYVGQGFRILKIKLGEVLEQDIDLLHRLHERLPSDIKIRVDMNQGYSLDELKRFAELTGQVNIELIEQPLARNQIQELIHLPQRLKKRVALDESLISVNDAFNLVSTEKPCGIFNIKLMKCGGITPALQIAGLAEYAGMDLMWGCMDESIIGISAALHAALASPQTRYLDLDGSFDLARDLAKGGFILRDGCLYTNDKPGLGVELL